MKILSLHITDRCNSACSFCVVASPLHAVDTVSYDRILEFLREHAGTGIDVVNLHGGEPTVHPKFDELLNEIHRLGYPELHLQTNAIRLHDDRFVGTLIDRGVRKFIISLHGDTPALQDALTFTRGGFVKTIAGIENVVRRGIHVRTNTVILKQNFSRLTEICELACNLGVAHVNLSALHPVGSALFSRSSDMPSYTDMHADVMKATALVLERGKMLTLEGFPHCIIKERVEHQLTHEYRDIKMLSHDVVMTNYDEHMAGVLRAAGPPCQTCALKRECGGPYPQYVDYYGWNEFTPMEQLATAGLSN